MDPNRSRRDRGRYPSGNCGCGRQETAERSMDRSMDRSGCGCDNPMEKIDSYALAMAYVPWQKFCETYDLEKAFCTGTIFPELDKPFMRARCSGK